MPVIAAVVPDYEKILAKIPEIIASIISTEGYSVNLSANHVSRDFYDLKQVMEFGKWPFICCARRKDFGSSRSVEDGSRDTYYSRLPIMLTCYLRVDKSSTELAETQTNALQNDLQKKLYDRHQLDLRPLGGVDIGFPEEPVVVEGMDKEGVIYVIMLLPVEVSYFLPRRGY